MNRTLLICILFIFFVSCTNRKSLLSLFDQQKNISHVSIIQPAISHYPYSLALYDTLLVWADPFDDKHLTLFDVRNNKQVHRFGFIGNGPGEIMMWSAGKKYQQKYYHMYDVNQKRLVEYSIVDAARDSMYRPKVSYNLHRLPSLFGTAQVSDDLFIGQTSHSDEIYALFDGSGNLIFSGYTYPEDDKKNLPPNVKSFAYQGQFHQNPYDNSLLVHVGIYGAIIDILKIENNKIVRKKRHKYVLPKYSPFYIGDMSGIIQDKDNIIGSCDVAVTKDFIYILYADKTAVNECNESNSRSSDIILVFNWSGEPVMYYKSDVELYRICVSDDNQTMYGVIMNPEAELVKFSL